MTKKTIDIKPEVALSEAQAEIAYLRNRNLILAQVNHEMATKLAALQSEKETKQ